LTANVISLNINPGIQRDGTQFDSDKYVDGMWVRFQRGRPRKIGGYNGIFLNSVEISRGMTMQSQLGLNYFYSGGQTYMQMWETNNTNGVGSGPYQIGFIGSITGSTIKSGGSGYTNGTYAGVSLTGGSGTGATANITVFGNSVITVTVVSAGSGYSTTDILSAAASSIGGTGSGFTLSVTATNLFVPSANNLWQFDIGFDPNGTGNLNVIAHPGQNLSDIDNTVNTNVLYGQFPGGSLSKVGVFTATGTVSGTTFTISSGNYLIGVGQTVSGGGFSAGTTVVSSSVAGTVTTVILSTSGSSGSQTLTFDNNISVSGGACYLYPYLFVYGNNGLIQNNSAGNLNNWVGADANSNTVSSTKVVRGMPLRGGTTSPAGLFWSLDQLTRVTYAPQTVGTSVLYWRYDIISTQTSILSSNCVIEYDGIFYWIGVDRFLMYNGVVQEIPNPVNQNYFFDNLNFAQRQKVWAMKIPRWGEIWWFYPAGSSTECNNAIIYNVREKSWYDAGFAPGASRSAGVFSEVFKYPVWADVTANTSGTYTIWQHETGVDQVYLTQVDAIQSYIETNSIGWVKGGPGVAQLQGPNNYIRLERVEPDFVQVGNMNLYIKGKGYADDADVVSQYSPYVFSPNTLKIDMKEQYREMRLRFESNTYNGNYQMGNVLLSADVGDVRSTGNP